MPFYRNEENTVKILFIHIPRTGGTSVERYFKKKPGLTEYSYGILIDSVKTLKNIKCSLQHLVYKDLVKHRDFLNINIGEPDVQMITVVRNPYYRILSDLLFHGKIQYDTPVDQITDIIRLHIVQNPDNHTVQQYTFLLDENGDFLKNINILHTETLVEDMKKLEFTDFKNYLNCSGTRLNYDEFLNQESIDIINMYYKKDFEYFGYTMK